MKILVIGGVAGGASAAARLRRLSEDAEIIMFERGEYISFANCGLPYHVGEAIDERSELILMTPEKFTARTGVQVRTSQEVTAIDRDKKSVTVNKVGTDETYEESYDKVILATGSSPVKPPIPGADDPDVLHLWTIPNMDQIISRIDAGATRATVIGAGFIGIEVAENLIERGLSVNLIEALPQVLATLDEEMTQSLVAELRRKGIALHLNAKVTEISRHDGLVVNTETGDSIASDFIVMSAGVRPNSELAADAGLELSDRKGIVVNERMQTADPDVYAVGDVVSVKNLVTEQPAMIPLAGPANRQGRIAADAIMGKDSTYKGSLGTSVVKVFNLTAASSGMTERLLKAADLSYEKVYLHPFSNATYYPGARPISIKLLFASDGQILGVQAVGEKGVEKRVDVIATAMRGGMTVFDLEELELAYAPPYGSAKDPVNFAGMIAANVLRGDSTVVHCDAIPDDAFLLDVREPAEYDLGHMDNSTLIPLGTLRERLDELPKDKRIVVYCKVGLRGYLGERILKENGFDSTNLSGGWTTWQAFYPAPPVETPKAAATSEAIVETTSVPKESKTVKTIDLTGMQCPGPIIRLRQELDALNSGETIALTAMPGFEPDLRAWCQSSGNALVSLDASGDQLTAQIAKGDGSASTSCGSTPDSAAIVCFSNDLDKVMAAFIIATGMASLGCKVKMFFTFWGLNVLRKEDPPSVTKDILSKMFGFMMPRGAKKLALSKMHMGGMGTAMMKYVMNKKNVASLPELVQNARDLGVTFIACDMAMDVMGIQREELLDVVDEVAGVASFAALAKESGTTLFI